jgi:hypothetical protein
MRRRLYHLAARLPGNHWLFFSAAFLTAFITLELWKAYGDHGWTWDAPLIAIGGLWTLTLLLCYVLTLPPRASKP